MHHQSRSSVFDSADGSLNYSICLGSTWSGRVLRSTHIVASSKNLEYCLCGLCLDFRSGGRNRCRRTMVPCFGLRLGKDNIWIRFVNKPCTTTAYPHCHLDSLSSVKMLWSAEMTSAKTVAAKRTVISGIRLTSALCSDSLCYFVHVAIRIFRNMCEYVTFTRRLAQI